MLDCQAEELLPEEKEKLAHPVVGGVILFTRNYHDKRQLSALVQDIRRFAKNNALIAVDHEGGRVQRFRDGFTAIPAMGDILRQSEHQDESAAYAKACGLALAYELKTLDIDFSFAPVLDINGVSQVIGDRAFSHNADEVIRLATQLIQGLKTVNMPAIGKHFPGHGTVAPDSHIALPVDERGFDEIRRTDMVVFERVNERALLDGVMPAHVIYNQVCDKPAGFSSTWLKTILKNDIGFNGAVFSDDLSMHGASVAGSYVERAEAALEAGCDMVLACNNPKGAESILDGLEARFSNPNNSDVARQERVMALYGRVMPAGLYDKYESAAALIARLSER
ncbi:beta-hexosaminidase [Alteromonas mediterranea MED64]|uniref:beta-N-acetylhexosaminidase n=1 Tax=Alteromonas mediterranea TaxID=314275 RepID=UPI0003557E77|nr:beta-N-acetylhexosaminidase [Alteromonas mediterranea]AGP81560.1 beta-hexosaminidase [Alteromonas mediterranea MED64]